MATKLSNMARTKKVIDWVTLPSEIIKGSIVTVEVNIKGKRSAKSGLKVTNLNNKTITVMEVDKANKKNIFRKFLLTDIVELGSSAEHQIVLKSREGVLPRKEESGWDSIGHGGYQRRGWRAYSNHSKGWSSNAPQYRSTTNNPVSGFPMV